MQCRTVQCLSLDESRVSRQNFGDQVQWSPHHTALYCIVVQCNAVHCTSLHCTTMHCTALYCTTLYCTTLHCTTIHCPKPIMHYTTPYCNTLNCNLHYIALHITALYWTTPCIALHCIQLQRDWEDLPTTGISEIPVGAAGLAGSGNISDGDEQHYWYIFQRDFRSDMSQKLKELVSQTVSVWNKI